MSSAAECRWRSMIGEQRPASVATRIPSPAEFARLLRLDRHASSVQFRDAWIAGLTATRPMFAVLSTPQRTLCSVITTLRCHGAIQTASIMDKSNTRLAAMPARPWFVGSPSGIRWNWRCPSSTARPPTSGRRHSSQPYASSLPRRHQRAAAAAGAVMRRVTNRRAPSAATLAA
jgi:hypothetical protein